MPRRAARRYGGRRKEGRKASRPQPVSTALPPYRPTALDTLSWNRLHKRYVSLTTMTPFDLIAIGGGTAGLVTRKNGRIVGATVLGSGAGDLILPLVMAMNARMKISMLSHVVYPYPTMVEGVKRAADSYSRERFAGRTGEWLRKVVRWLK